MMRGPLFSLSKRKRDKAIEYTSLTARSVVVSALSGSCCVAKIHMLLTQAARMRSRNRYRRTPDFPLLPIFGLCGAPITNHPNDPLSVFRTPLGRSRLEAVTA
jgi:hypothetical protein